MPPFSVLIIIVTVLFYKFMSTESSPLRNVVSTFRPANFKPPSGLLSSLFSNCHWQTIVGSEAIRVKLFGAYPRAFSTETERFITPDGDFFDVDWVYAAPDEGGRDKEDNNKGSNKGKGMVVLLHGLESNTHGPLITKMTTAFLSKGFSCCLVSFRGCNGQDNDTPGAYHLGFTNDLNQVCRTIHERQPDLSIYVSGFSLGGNVALKYLGELSDEAPLINVRGGVATCVPFDPSGCQGKIDKGFNRAVYSMNFLKTLKVKAERQIQRFPGSFDIDAVRRCDTMGDFDDAYIAKIYGFKDKFDYYYQAGSIRYLSRIRVPAIAINAIDDPFIEESSLPSENEHVGPIAPVRLIYHEKGGHCGFCAEKADGLPEHGWLAEEMARALLHIHMTTVTLRNDGSNKANTYSETSSAAAVIGEGGVSVDDVDVDVHVDRVVAV